LNLDFGDFVLAVMMCLEVESFESLAERMLTEPCTVSKVNEIDGEKESRFGMEVGRLDRLRRTMTFEDHGLNAILAQEDSTRT
jgi:hypothetical protein